MGEILKKDIPVFLHIIGDPKYDVKAGVIRQDSDGTVSQLPELTEYYVELPEYLAHGFPNKWLFAIIRISGDDLNQALREKLIQNIHTIINAHPLQNEVPVLFISMTNAFQVSDELPPKRLSIFGMEIDETDLFAERRMTKVQPHLSPLITVVRKSLTSQQQGEFWLSPYRKSTPADGWRFFGREKEIMKITETMDNFVVVGARRIGKTSLLMELSRTLKKQGYTVYNVDTQSCMNEKDLTNKLIAELDPKAATYMKRREGILPTNVLENVLKYLSKQRNVAILIDEIGNLLARHQDQAEAWKIMGILRSYTHKGHIKLVCTASQTFLLKQQQDYSGPWVNFATTIVLRGLTREEAQDFILKPLQIWRLMTKAECNEVLDLIYNNVGSHPLLLTAYCEALFARVVGKETSVVEMARDLLKGRDEGVTKAINEVFFAISRPVIQYLFLQHCLERHAAKEKLMHSFISESWIDETLRKAGYKSRFATRLFLLEALNTRALTEPDLKRDDQCRVIAPLVFNYSKLHMPLEEKRDALREEIALDAEEFELVKV
jgi:hypothetical protein